MTNWEYYKEDILKIVSCYGAFRINKKESDKLEPCYICLQDDASCPMSCKFAYGNTYSYGGCLDAKRAWMEEEYK